MKKKLKLVGFTFCLVAGIYLGSNQNNEISTLVLDNIEALAYGEHGGIVRCYGDGSVDCHGYWVEMKITGLSLE